MTTPPATPRPAATVMLLRDAPELEVLLLERSTSTPFVPGAHVFPGGRVERRDRLDDSLVSGLSTDEADRVLGRLDARTFWVAAVRECLEEAGVLVAATSDGRLVDHDHPALEDLDRLRSDVEEGRRALAGLLRDHDLHLPLDRLAYVSRWITPELSPRRYDTRFFVAAMPDRQTASPDGWEATTATWRRPADALADWQAGRIELITPTVASLQLLERFDSAEHALDELHSAAARPERLVEPTGGERVVLDDERGTTVEEAS